MEKLNPKTLSYLLKNRYRILRRPSDINAALCEMGYQRRIERVTGFCRYQVVPNCPFGEMVEGDDFYTPRWDISVLEKLVEYFSKEK